MLRSFDETPQLFDPPEIFIAYSSHWEALGCLLWAWAAQRTIIAAWDYRNISIGPQHGLMDGCTMN